MSELERMEAALHAVRVAADHDASMLAVKISAGMLANAIAAARSEGVNPARVNDIEFALNDLVAAIDDAGVPDQLVRSVASLQNDAAALREQAALPAPLVASVRDLQEKLRARAHAIERSHYRIEGSPEEPLPHPPAELRELAIPILRQLTAEGFQTPTLQTLIADPQELRFHTINELIDELDVVIGG